MKKILFLVVFVLSFSFVFGCSNTKEDLRIKEFSNSQNNVEQGEDIKLTLEFNDLNGITIEDIQIFTAERHNIGQTYFSQSDNTITITNYFQMNEKSMTFRIEEVTFSIAGETHTLKGSGSIHTITVSPKVIEEEEETLEDFFLNFSASNEEAVFLNRSTGFYLTANNLPQDYEITYFKINGINYQWVDQKEYTYFINSQGSNTEMIINEVTIVNKNNLEETKLSFGENIIYEFQTKYVPLSYTRSGVSFDEELSDFVRLDTGRNYAMELNSIFKYEIILTNERNVEIKEIFLVDKFDDSVYYRSTNFVQNGNRLYFDIAFAEKGEYSLAFSHLSYEREGEQFETEKPNAFTFFNFLITDNLIKTPEDFLEIQNNPNQDYLIVNDLDFSKTDYTAYVPEFGGRLDGNGHKINNSQIDGMANSSPLVDTLLTGGIITNIQYDFGSFVYEGLNPVASFVTENNGTINKITLNGNTFSTANRNNQAMGVFVYQNNGAITNVNISPDKRLTIDTMSQNTSIIAVNNDGNIENISVAFRSFRYGDTPSSTEFPSLNYVSKNNFGSIKNILLDIPLFTQNVSLGTNLALFNQELRMVINHYQPQNNEGTFENIMFPESSMSNVFNAHDNKVLTPEEFYNTIIDSERFENYQNSMFEKFQGPSADYNEMIYTAENSSWVDDMTSYMSGEESQSFIKLTDFIFYRNGVTVFSRELGENFTDIFDDLNFSPESWDNTSFAPKLKH